MLEENKVPGISGRDPKRPIILGCIKQGPKNAKEIIQFLHVEGCMAATDAANVYRIIRQMAGTGLIREERGKRKSFVLTKFGEQHCPDTDAFQRLIEAARTIMGLKEHGFVPKPEKPENKEKSLVEAASEALQNIEGVVSEKILAPLRKLIETVGNTEKGQ